MAKKLDLWITSHNYLGNFQKKKKKHKIALEEFL